MDIYAGKHYSCQQIMSVDGSPAGLRSTVEDTSLPGPSSLPNPSSKNLSDVNRIRPRTMASDHSANKCALTSLEPAQSLPLELVHFPIC